jgi:2-dehydro-3-deoxyphosphooctonate aldolase (KDO 8-P synthase)
MTNAHHISLKNFQIGNDLPFVLIAGPCQMESRDHALKTAEALKEMAAKRSIPFIYKTSFDKANRTSLQGARGLGLEKALDIFQEIRTKLDCPVITDVHSPDQCTLLKEAVDMLQIPAFLCRQTDLLVAAAKTKLPINVKKGQFLAPWDMKNVVQKLKDSGNDDVLLCERGATFGYNRLTVDMTSFPIMAQTGCPVVFDATHSVQEPGGKGSSTGGNRVMAPILARAAMAIGVAAVFMETHEDPDSAPSDGPNMIYLDAMPKILDELQAIDQFSKANPRHL